MPLLLLPTVLRTTTTAMGDRGRMRRKSVRGAIGSHSHCEPHFDVNVNVDVEKVQENEHHGIES